MKKLFLLLLILLFPSRIFAIETEQILTNLEGKLITIKSYEGNFSSVTELWGEEIGYEGKFIVSLPDKYKYEGKIRIKNLEAYSIQLSDGEVLYRYDSLSNKI